MSPALYEPLAVKEFTEATTGAVVSMMMSLLLPKEFVAPGVGKVKTALFKDASFIVPEFRASELVAT